MPNATTNPGRRKAAPKPRILPAYNLADGACSFRHSLTARERTALDRALEIVGRHMYARPAFECPAAVKEYCQIQLGGEPAEHFAVLFLDAQHRGTAFERMFTGSLTQTSAMR